MKLRSPWRAISHSATQEFPDISKIPKVNYHVNKSPSLIPVLSHMDTLNEGILNQRTPNNSSTAFSTSIRVHSMV
jgi:hypothetical protein